MVFSGKYDCEVGSTPYFPGHGPRPSENTLRILALPLNLYLQISYRLEARSELGTGREDGWMRHKGTSWGNGNSLIGIVVTQLCVFVKTH